MKQNSLSASNASRRDFLKASALLAGGAFVLPRFSIGQSGPSANSKLNIAFIGVGAQGRSNLTAMAGENVVALCDVDPVALAKAAESFPKARQFTDYRKMFDQMGNEIDAVGVATADHTHFVTSMAAADLGKHLFVQKPLVHNIYELRTLCEKARSNKLVTQMGNQGRAFEGMRLIKEWFDYGTLGEVKEVVAWTNRPATGVGFRRAYHRSLPAAEPKPDGLDWDLWLGPAPQTGYSSELHPGFWRGWWDYGCGGLGDIGCHTIDIPYLALQLGHPSKIEVELSEPVNDVYTPSGSIVTYHFPARGGMPPVKVKWYEGPAVPPMTENYLAAQAAELKATGQDTKKLRKTMEGGLFMLGSEQTLFSPGMRPDSPRLLDEEAWEAFRRNRPPKVLPRVKGGNIKEWIRAVKGEGPTPGSNFDYAEGLTELILLGALAIRTGKSLEWDPVNMEVTNHRDLERYLKPEPRKGWGEYY
ncbi:Gfo/Idh/MocA family oxidoreductase [Pelagicoccus enzymogenes]|uniref:Gfo/Idh/MocA family protein n=1 Tax=Pelagicoccus enzymogenes TaxID=2773457 RepID=UPI00280EDD3A|nr:Gfo/Idh/MocA family oxidoreductase [Pelagicoccus enzymogenes]MDQ8197864.1 Gfo/Idh/MocA family oxidoreductase [Pelagicoccus enzymogenes]